ncbi:hypothetical protein VNO77_14658 [Canavalia gladiata]|uniref:Uncharacterized protein n=1 Tax=Canavalia gladiata TaxID=3824 RepID=A0AAN9M3N6_CANGL
MISESEERLHALCVESSLHGILTFEPSTPLMILLDQCIDLAMKTASNKGCMHAWKNEKREGISLGFDDIFAASVKLFQSSDSVAFQLTDSLVTLCGQSNGEDRPKHYYFLTMQSRPKTENMEGSHTGTPSASSGEHGSPYDYVVLAIVRAPPWRSPNTTNSHGVGNMENNKWKSSFRACFLIIQLKPKIYHRAKMLLLPSCIDEDYACTWPCR